MNENQNAKPIWIRFRVVVASLMVMVFLGVSMAAPSLAAEEPKRETPKRDEPKREPQKREEPKREPPKREEPKREAPKREEPKAPKREEVKRDEPKRQEPKREPQKREEPKREPQKREAPQREEPKRDEPQGNEQKTDELKPEPPRREGPKRAVSRMRGNMARGEWDELLLGAQGATIKRYEVALLVRLLADDGWNLTETRRELLRDIACTSRRILPSGSLFGRLIKEASRSTPSIKPLLTVTKEQLEQCFGPECPSDWYYVPDGSVFFTTPDATGSTDKKEDAHPVDVKEIRKTLTPPYQRYVDMRHWESYYACFYSPYDTAFAALVALLETRHGNDIPQGLRPVFLEFARGEVSVDTFAILMKQAYVMPELFPLLIVRDDFIQTYPRSISPVPLIDPRPKPFKELCRDLRLLDD